MKNYQLSELMKKIDSWSKLMVVLITYLFLGLVFIALFLACLWICS